VRIWLFIALLSISACGGSGGGGKEPPGNVPPPAGLPPIGTTIKVAVSARTEFEPNDSIQQADSQTMPVPGVTADYVGFGVFGEINDTTDVADYFLFTPHRDHVFTVQMCETFCDPVGNGQRIDTSVAYFEVLDQDGTLLMSSQGDISAGNYQEVSTTGGLVYYLAVFPDDTVGATAGYYVEMVEDLPFGL